MKLFLTGSEAAGKEVHTLATHLAQRYGLVAQGRSSRTAVIAVDSLSHEHRTGLLSAAKQAADDLHIDQAVLPSGCALEQFSLLATDMDSTLIDIECIDEIADQIGKKAEVAAITDAAMRGELVDFADSLKRRVALLAGAPVSVLETVYLHRLRLSAGAQILLAAAAARSIKTLLVSGGFTFFTDRLKSTLQLDFTAANSLEVQDGVLTGGLIGPILDAEGKRSVVLACCRQLGIGSERVLALGDGANDLRMFEAAGLSVAYHAKPAVCAAADVAICYGGLDVLLEWI